MNRRSFLALPMLAVVPTRTVTASTYTYTIDARTNPAVLRDLLGGMVVSSLFPPPRPTLKQI